MNPLQHHADIAKLVLSRALQRYSPHCMVRERLVARLFFATALFSRVCRLWRRAIRELLGEHYQVWIATRNTWSARNIIKRYADDLESVWAVCWAGLHPADQTKRRLSDERRWRKHCVAANRSTDARFFREDSRLKSFLITIELCDAVQQAVERLTGSVALR
jgi:hypothetical protein